MALTPSTMLELGTTAPDFALPEPLTGKTVSLDDFHDASALAVVFMCNHCPYVKHIRKQLVDFANDYRAKGLAVVAVSSNDVANYPDDAPDKMAADAKTLGYPFPYLYDEDQSVAKAYQAACTPDFYVFNGQMKLVYRGQLDSSRPRNDVPLTGEDVRAALDAVIVGEPVSDQQQPSIGCNIKWKEI